MENKTEEHRITGRQLKAVGGAVICGMLFLMTVYYLRTLFYSNAGYSLHWGSFTIEWVDFVNVFTAAIFLILGCLTLFLPRRFKYLYLGILIGFLLYSPSGGLMKNVSVYDDLYMLRYR